jgi:hypothetical protein
MYYRGMASLNGLPVFFIKIDESLESNQGIDMISCVDYPAIESNFVALSNIKNFAFNADKQMLYGAILIPNQPIYRNDPKMGEYYVIFTEQEIVKMVRKFQAQAKTVNLNYQHQKDSQLKNAVIQEIWLTGKNDKSQDLGFDFPINTAMIGAYIGDSKFWADEVKTGNVKGFSIEGFLDMEMKKFKHTYKMEVKTSDGAYTLSTQDDTFTVGAEVTITATDGTTVNEGTFNLDNGSTIVVAAGTITAIEDSPSEPEGELSNEEVAVIQSAMKSQIDELKGMIETLNQKFSNLPASQPITKTVEPEVKESKFEALRTILNKHKNK